MKPKTITLSDDAQQLIDDFIKYSELYMNDMADVMYYDYDGFRQKLKALKRDFEKQ